jgi:hypothetical protein
LAHRGSRNALRLLAAAEALRDARSAQLSAADSAEREHKVATMRAQLDDATFAAAWDAGQALTLEQAVDEAPADTQHNN